MTNLSILNTSIRALDNLYSLNDLHIASGNDPKHRPNQFIRLDTTQGLIAEIDRENTDAQICASLKIIKGGRNIELQGTCGKTGKRDPLRQSQSRLTKEEKTMNNTAIQEIRDLALSTLHIDETDYPVAIVPDNTTIFSLEDYQAHRNNYRVSLKTHHFGSYIRYVKDNAQPDAQCFVDPTEMSAKTIFDLGDTHTPGHADHTAILALKATAAYNAVSKIDGERLTQKALSDWLEDWADNITAFDAEGNEIGFFNALAAIRKITLDYAATEDHEVGDFAAKKSAMESVEAKSKLTIPHHFTFTCEPYNGLNIHDLPLRLRIITGEDVPILVLRLVKAEALTEAIAEEFADKVQDALNDVSLVVNIGTVVV